MSRMTIASLIAIACHTVNMKAGICYKGQLKLYNDYLCKLSCAYWKQQNNGYPRDLTADIYHTNTCLK